MRVAAHNKDAPTELDWRDVLSWTRERCAQPGIAKFLVVTDGGAPNARQRNEFAKAVEGHETRTAVITGSTIARSVITAMQWFTPGIRGFAPLNINDALAYLDVAPVDWERLTTTIRELRIELAASSERSEGPNPGV